MPCYLALIKRQEDNDEPGDISHFQALMTALAATVGTGNIAGVATAISAGGPGAIFWMWVTGLVGMATKYAEAVLAVKYRRRRRDGQMCGGPMYYLAKASACRGWVPSSPSSPPSPASASAIWCSRTPWPTPFAGDVRHRAAGQRPDHGGRRPAS